jgi:hypothetical protein
LAFYLTDDEMYAKKAVSNLRVWFIDAKTRMNPNLNFGQTIPGRNNGRGRGEGLIDTYSFIDMLEGVALLEHSANFTSDDQQKLKDWFEAFLNWMLTSETGQEEYNAKNNHGTAYDIQVVRYALYVGKEQLAREILKEFPTRRMFSQIEPDGSQPLELARTTAFGYSVFNLTHFLDMCCLARKFDMDLFYAKSSDGRSIPKAIDFLIPWLGKPISDFPYKQIRDWEKVQEDFCRILYRADSFTPIHEYRPHYAPYLKLDNNDRKNILF